jgi:hypothetical protein
MSPKVRLHTDLLPYPPPYYLSYEHYLAVTALSNARMMHLEDLDDLPNTAMQRFLRAAGACVAGRTYVGRREDREALRDAAGEFQLGWGAFAVMANRRGVEELSFEDAWDMYVRWRDSGETWDPYDPDGDWE